MMMKAVSMSAVALLLAACGSQETPAAEEQVAEAQPGADLPDTPGDGPYPAMMEVDPLLPDYVVYRPEDLAAVGKGKLGVFVWGNGGCVDDASSSRQHLAEIASYGYLVIAPGKWRSGPNARDPQVPPRVPDENGKFPPTPTEASALSHALDWALEENTREGSRYAGLIDEKALAAGGYSCGGVQALKIAGDPRLDTVVVQNSGILTDPETRIPGMDLEKSALEKLHTPVIYLQGGKEDIAYDNGMDDFQRITNVPAVMVNIPTGHAGTYDEPMGGKAARIVVDWLDWQLRGSEKARATFMGEDCGLCTDPEATIERKNMS